MNIQNSSKLTEIIYTALKNKYTELNWCIYPTDKKLNSAHLPIAHLELESFQHDKETSDYKKVTTNFAVRLLYSDQPEQKLHIRDMALNIGCFIDQNRFNQPQIFSCDVLSSQPDFMTPEIEGFTAWEVNFAVTIFLGETIYEPNFVSQEFNIEVNENAGY